MGQQTDDDSGGKNIANHYWSILTNSSINRFFLADKHNQAWPIPTELFAFVVGVIGAPPETIISWFCKHLLTFYGH